MIRKLCMAFFLKQNSSLLSLGFYWCCKIKSRTHYMELGFGYNRIDGLYLNEMAVITFCVT